MKRLLLISLLGTGLSAAHAQNTTPFPASGNVGIGTTSPQTSLQVQKTSNQPAIMIGGGYAGSPRLQIYGLSDDGQAFMGLGTDMAGGPYEHSIFFPTGPGNAPGKLTIGDFNGSTYNTRVSVLQNGNVGIGTIAPTELLTIGNESPGAGRKVLRFSAGSYGEPAALYTPSAGDKIILYDASVSGYDARIGIGSRANFWMKSFAAAGGSYGSFEWFAGSNSSSPQMVLSGAGNLSIGTTDAKGYKLAVAGSAVAESVTVKLQSNWPDYVFKPSYHLPALSRVKTYIDGNGHLPGMPSSAEAQKQGVNLGEMNTLLLKKVEELTLYLISEHDKNQQQQAQISKLNKRIEALSIGRNRLAPRNKSK